ncbi:EB module [Ancylostoma duodenale]|uniref:EB module n=1 Tax=Ancylostoma duodenale TaxID=51022 RepID=A0A0C2DVD0_9BILA|nr:EB module [Ancylostoma duodenale]
MFRRFSACSIASQTSAFVVEQQTWEYAPREKRYNNRVCIGPASGYCPSGRAPYKDQMSTQAMRCTMSAHVSTCPDGFECQSDVRDALQGYCCSVSDICPHKEEYFVDETSGMPRSCSIGHFVTCPAGFTCMTQSEGVSGYCCRGKPHLLPSDGCPPGEIVFMAKNEVVICDPFNPSNQGCPNGFTCQWSVRTQRYQCCGANSMPPALESDGCPSRQIAFTDVASGKPQVAFIGMSGEHQRCSMSGGQACPEGFTCVKGKNNDEICCAGGEDAPRDFHSTSACDSTQVSVNGRCLPVQHIGSKCEHDSQCLGDSKCSDGVCQCPEGTVEQKQRCVAAVKGLCPSSRLPYLVNGVAKHCTGGRSCPSGYTCTFSRSGRNYYCCSNHEQSRLDGKMLMFH